MIWPSLTIAAAMATLESIMSVSMCVSISADRSSFSYVYVTNKIISFLLSFCFVRLTLYCECVNRNSFQFLKNVFAFELEIHKWFS